MGACAEGVRGSAQQVASAPLSTTLLLWLPLADAESPVAPASTSSASQRNGTLYTGVTSNLPQRIWQHKHGLGESFASRYGAHILVWYELHETMMSAIGREKAIKKWNRIWKIRLIEESNPDWRDLYQDIG